MGKVKAIILLGVSGVLAGLALAIVLLNWVDWNVHLVFVKTEMRSGTLLGFAAVAGCILWAVWRAAVPAGFAALREARKRERTKATQSRLSKLEGGPGASAPPSEADTGSQDE